MSTDGNNTSTSAPSGVVYYTGLDPQEYSSHPEYRLIAAFFLGALFMSSLSSIIYSPIFKSFLNQLFNHNRNRANDLESLPITTDKVKDLHRTPSTSTSVLVRRNNGTLGFAMSVCFAIAGVTQFATLFSYAATLACAFVVALGTVSEQCGRVLALIILGFHLRRLDLGRVEFICMWVWLAVATTLTLVTNAIGTGTIMNVTNPTFGLCYRTHYLPTMLLSSIMYIILEIYIIVRLAMLIPRTRHRLAFLVDLRVLRAFSILVFDLLVIVPSAYYISTVAEFVPFCIGTSFVLAAFHAHIPDFSTQPIEAPSFRVDINPIRVGTTPISAAPATNFNHWQQSQMLSPTAQSRPVRGQSIATNRSYVSAGNVSNLSTEPAVIQGAYRQKMTPEHLRGASQDMVPPKRGTGMTSIPSPTIPRFKVVNPEPEMTESEDHHPTGETIYSSAVKHHAAGPSDESGSTVSSGAALMGYLRRGTLEVELASLEYELRSPTTASPQFAVGRSASDGAASRKRDTASTFPDPRDYTDPSAIPPRPSTQRRSTRPSRPSRDQRLSTITSVTTDTVISDLSFARSPKLEPPLPYPSEAQAFAASTTQSAVDESTLPTLADRRIASNEGIPSDIVKKPSMERRISPPREFGLQVRGPRAPKSAVDSEFDSEEVEVPAYEGKGKGRKRSSTIF